MNNLPWNWEFPRGREFMIFKRCELCNGEGTGAPSYGGSPNACRDCKGLGGMPVKIETLKDPEMRRLLKSLKERAVVLGVDRVSSEEGGGE